MDAHYDTAKAKAKLENIVTDRLSMKEEELGVYQLNSFEISDLKVRAYGGGFIQRLYLAGQGQEEEEDVYFRLMGVIGSKLLPPIGKPQNRTSMLRARPHMKQQITLTGLGLDYFDNAVRNLEQLYLLFYQELTDDSLLPWQCQTSHHYPALDTHNKYFSRRSRQPGQEQVALAQNVDPEGTLAGLSDNEFVHTSDNAVEYFEHRMDSHGAHKYLPAGPTAFKVGDIVEATFTIACYPTKARKYKMQLILRGLTLVNTDERNAAALARMKNRRQDVGTANNAPRKRKPIYMSDVLVDATRQKLTKMSIEEDSMDAE